jgi:Tfp pilus assembly protein PilF
MNERQTDSDSQAVIATFWEKAEQAVAQNQPEQARAWMEGIVELDAQNVDAWLRLASLISDPREQMQCYARVLELNPGNVQAKAGIRKAMRQS